MKKIAVFVFTVILCLMSISGVYANSLTTLNNVVKEKCGTSESDWSAVALYLSGVEFDKEAYLSALGEYVAEKYKSEYKLSRNKSTEWHRIAITVNLLGKDAADFYGADLIGDGVYFREGLGKQGLNGYIWGLIAISSGDFAEPENAINTHSSIISEILSRQNEDGGFAISSDKSDCDITSMAIYALSFYKNDLKISSAIERAVNYLSTMQNDDGTFSANGVANAESTAQAIIALSALGIDTRSDSRFINIPQALEIFHTAEGFSHICGEKTDIIATYQAECALAADRLKMPVYSAHNNIHKTEIKKEDEKIDTETAYDISPQTDFPSDLNTEEETCTIAAEMPSDISTQTPTEKSTDLQPRRSDINMRYLYPFFLAAVLLAAALMLRKRK